MTAAAKYKGPPCPRGHTLRYVSTCLRVECKRLKDSQLTAIAKLKLPPEIPLPPPRVGGMVSGRFVGPAKLHGAGNAPEA